MQIDSSTLRIKDKTFEVLFTHESIQKRVQELALQISQIYANATEVYVIGILNGAFRFVADLLTHLPEELSVYVDFVKVSSYEGTNSIGKIQEAIALKQSLTNKHVLLVEDIIDTGLTMQYLIQKIQAEQPASLKVMTLLFKPQALQACLMPDFVGFEIAPLFVIGYGLDYNEQGRNLNNIYVLKNIDKA